MTGKEGRAGQLPWLDRETEAERERERAPVKDRVRQRQNRETHKDTETHRETKRQREYTMGAAHSRALEARCGIYRGTEDNIPSQGQRSSLSAPFH